LQSRRTGDDSSQASPVVLDEQAAATRGGSRGAAGPGESITGQTPAPQGAGDSDEPTRMINNADYERWLDFHEWRRTEDWTSRTPGRRSTAMIDKMRALDLQPRWPPGP
jgi:hypothetical protein